MVAVARHEGIDEFRERGARCAVDEFVLVDRRANRAKQPIRGLFGFAGLLAAPAAVGQIVIDPLISLVIADHVPIFAFWGLGSFLAGRERAVLLVVDGFHVRGSPCVSPVSAVTG